MSCRASVRGGAFVAGRLPVPERWLPGSGQGVRHVQPAHFRPAWPIGGWARTDYPLEYLSPCMVRALTGLSRKLKQPLRSMLPPIVCPPTLRANPPKNVNVDSTSFMFS